MASDNVRQTKHDTHLTKTGVSPCCSYFMTNSSFDATKMSQTSVGAVTIIMRQLDLLLLQKQRHKIELGIVD